MTPSKKAKDKAWFQIGDTDITVSELDAALEAAYAIDVAPLEQRFIALDIKRINLEQRIAELEAHLHTYSDSNKQNEKLMETVIQLQAENQALKEQVRLKAQLEQK